MSSVTAVPLRPIARGALGWLWFGLAVLAIIGIGVAWVGTQKLVSAARPAEEILASNAKQPGVVTTSDGLQYKVLAAGSGPRPTISDIVAVEYAGRLANGDLFDSSDMHGGPAQFPVAAMMPGFAEALTLMPVGARYRVWIPPALGYGAEGRGPIPPNALLIFDIHLLAAAPPSATQQAPAGTAQ